MAHCDGYCYVLPVGDQSGLVGCVVCDQSDKEKGKVKKVEKVLDIRCGIWYPIKAVSQRRRKTEKFVC